MQRFSFLAAVLPVLALAACSDDEAEGRFTLAPDVTQVASRGALLARDYCAPCHGATLRGATRASAVCPSLEVVRSYSPEEFDRLLATGEARDGDAVDPSMLAGQDLSYEDRELLLEYLRAYLGQ